MVFFFNIDRITRTASCLGITILLLLWGSIVTYAQTPRQLADEHFYRSSYAEAIAAYEPLLRGQSLSEDEKRDVLYRLGRSYYALKDFSKAERTFKELLDNTEPLSPPHQDAYLYYAKAVGAGGNLTEAQRLFAHHEEIQSRSVSKASTPINLLNDLSSYRIEDLSLNSPDAEFSPAYFRDGLVYVAGRNSSSTDPSEKGHLNLMYVPIRKDLVARTVKDASGISTPLRTSATDSRVSRPLGSDAYTRPTSNDSRTVGTYAPLNFGYGLNRRQATSQASNTSASLFSPALTSRYHEGPMTFTADGSRIYFTRNSQTSESSGTKKESIRRLKLFTAVLGDGGWSGVEELPFNSDTYSVGHPALTRDGSQLYFVSDMPGGLGGTDLYVVSRTPNGWSAPTNLGPKVNTNKDEMFPFVDENGHLYFASSGRTPSLGGLDIYYATLEGGVIQGVAHLPAPLNSSADDFGLITDGNREKGYFSTNRGKGDDNIFKFVRESAILNCHQLTIEVIDATTKLPIGDVEIKAIAKGEGRDEINLKTDQTGATTLCLETNNTFTFEFLHENYVATVVGLSTIGFADKPRTKLSVLMNTPPPVKTEPIREPASDDTLSASILRGVVSGEGDKGAIEGVLIKLKNECDGTLKQTTTGPDGRFQFDITAGCDYTLTAYKKTYGTTTNSIQRISSTSAPKLVSADLKMLKVGDIVKLNNIYHDKGKWELRPEVIRELDKMITTMRKYPTLRIEIGSHTDSQGDAKLNQYLSERRAKSILDYMASKGIARSRMTAKGYGESQLMNQCKDGVLCTEEEHQRNRRTEFKVLFIQ